MWCLACREYLQVGVRSSRVVGNPHLRVSTVKVLTKCGSRAKSLALWTRGGASSSVVGAPTSGVQFAIRGLFTTSYRVVKREGNFMDVVGDAELVHVTGGSITPSYMGRVFVVNVLHDVASPYRADENAAIQSQFFGLASDSCTDRGLTSRS